MFLTTTGQVWQQGVRITKEGGAVRYLSENIFFSDKFVQTNLAELIAKGLTGKICFIAVGGVNKTFITDTGQLWMTKLETTDRGEMLEFQLVDLTPLKDKGLQGQIIEVATYDIAAPYMMFRTDKGQFWTMGKNLEGKLGLPPVAMDAAITDFQQVLPLR